LSPTDEQAVLLFAAPRPTTFLRHCLLPPHPHHHHEHRHSLHQEPQEHNDQQHHTRAINIFALQMEEQTQLQFGPRTDESLKSVLSAYALSQSLSLSAILASALQALRNTLFQDVPASLSDGEALLSHCLHLRQTDRAAYSAAFVSLSLAQLLEPFAVKELLAVLVVLLQRSLDPTTTTTRLRLRDMQWVRTLTRFEERLDDDLDADDQILLSVR
jgi:hypothetical protein